MSVDSEITNMLYQIVAGLIFNHLQQRKRLTHGPSCDLGKQPHDQQIFQICVHMIKFSFWVVMSGPVIFVFCQTRGRETEHDVLPLAVPAGIQDLRVQHGELGKGRPGTRSSSRAPATHAKPGSGNSGCHLPEGWLALPTIRGLPMGCSAKLF